MTSITFPDIHVMQRATFIVWGPFMFLIAVITFTFKIEAVFTFICFNILQIFIFKDSFACFRIGNWTMFHSSHLFARIFYVLFLFSLHKEREFLKTFTAARSWLLYSSNIPNLVWILWNQDGAFPCFSIGVDSFGIGVYSKFVPATFRIFLDSTIIKDGTKHII